MVSSAHIAGSAPIFSKPEAVNETPHGDGWYCRIEMTDPQEVEQLMDAEAYTTFVDSQ